MNDFGQLHSMPGLCGTCNTFFASIKAFDKHDCPKEDHCTEHNIYYGRGGRCRVCVKHTNIDAHQAMPDMKQTKLNHDKTPLQESLGLAIQILIKAQKESKKARDAEWNEQFRCDNCDEIKEEIKQLKKYARHKRDCNFANMGDPMRCNHDCNCGLEELLANTTKGSSE